MQLLADMVDKRCKVSYSLRDLRVAKGVTQKQMAHVLGISKSMYHSIENGHRRPDIDVLYKLAAIYQTSMDFVYHSYYRQHYIWNYPDDDLQYAMRIAKKIDIQYLRDRCPAPEPPPKLPVAIILERMGDEPGLVEENSYISN